MIYVLMIWTVVAASDSRGGTMKAYHDWRPLGEFQSQALCEQAAGHLGIQTDRYRCVKSR